MKQTRFSDDIGVVASIDPDATVASTVESDWVAMKDFSQVAAIVMAGAMGGGGTIDAKIEQASDGAGTGAKDITGLAITQLTQAGGDSDKQAVLEVSDDDLDVDNAFTHVRLSMTVAGATCDAGALLVGRYARYGKATRFDLASVAEVVAL